MLAKTNERGFTLAEVAIVTVLLAMLSGVIYSSFASITRTKEKLEAERAITRTGQYVIQKITRELQNRGEEPLAGYTNDIYLFGKNQQLNNRDADIIVFTSNGAGQALFEGSRNFGLVEVSYRIVEEQSAAGGMKRRLMREERPTGISDPKLLAQRTVSFPVSELVTSLNFRYRYRNRWLDDWNESRVQLLPQAVEVTIRVEDGIGTSETFRTAIALQYPK